MFTCYCEDRKRNANVLLCASQNKDRSIGIDSYNKTDPQSTSHCTIYSYNWQKEVHRLEDGAFIVLSGGEYCDNFEFVRMPMLVPSRPVEYCEDTPPNSMSYVGLHTYANLAEKRGFKVGQRQGNTIVWRNASEYTPATEPIVPCECWKYICISCQRLRAYVDRAPGSCYSRCREVSGPDDHCPECRAATLSAKGV